ncbi:MAG: DUF721 domain-containing protein [Acidimicrobiales bacterium]
MGTADRPLSPIATSIATLRRQFGLGSQRALDGIVHDWPELAGEMVAQRSDVIDLRAGVLTVDAYDPATADVLKWSQQRLLGAVREAWPGESVSSIAVRVRRRPDEASREG